MKSIMDKLKDILPGSDKEKEEKTPAGPEAQEQAESPAEPEKADAAAAEEARSGVQEDGNESAAPAAEEHLTIRVDYGEEEKPGEPAPVSQRDLLAARVLECLRARKFRYSVQRDDAKFFHVTMNMLLSGKLTSCMLHIFVNPGDIEVLAVCPVKATEDVRPQVAEYITRVNCTLKFGGFHMDYGSGEVRFSCALSAMEGMPSLRDVDRTIALPILMMNRYGDGLVKNLMGYGDPAADVEAAQRKK